MIEKKTIGINSLVTMGILSLIIIVPGFFDSPNYFCESRPEIGVVQCDDFSKYVAENGKCIREENTNLICREGWVLVTNDIDLPDDNETINIPDTIGKSYKIEQGKRPVLIK